MKKEERRFGGRKKGTPNSITGEMGELPKSVYKEELEKYVGVIDLDNTITLAKHFFFKI